MRAKLPHTTDYIQRPDVVLYHEVYGDGDYTILFLPTWSFVHSRCYKAQVPYFSERYKCVTYDPRGNGKSGRPGDLEAYSTEKYIDDAIAVLDATETEKAILFGFSMSGLHCAIVAAAFPERVSAVVTVGTNTPVEPTYSYKNFAAFNENLDSHEEWGKYNRQYWSSNYPDFADFFTRKIFVEPHSTKQIEDTIGWALETDAKTLTKTMDGKDTGKYAVDEAMYGRIRCPMLLIHGEDDPVAPLAVSKCVASLTPDSEVAIIPGAGHAPHGRYPARINTLVRDFLARKLGTWKPSKPATKKSRNDKKVLYLSSPIGLGHGRRDLAIAREMKKLCPRLQVDWLAQDPVTRFLDINQERIHPASKKLANESTHIESESGEHDLNAFQAIRRMDEILIANFMVFQEVLEQEDYDLVIADEAWDVDYYWHEHPELKQAQVAWMTDFVGWVPMPSGGEHEAFLTTDYNAENINHVESNPQLRDRAIFVGNPDDIVPLGFGRDLPEMREWIPQHFEFSGYILGQHPETFGPRSELREQLEFGDEPVCIVTVGGSGVGAPLIRRVLDAYPLARQRIPGLKMVVVAGPRIDPDSLKIPRGVKIEAFVPDLDRHLAACDLAVVQGGLTTCMELAAAGTPFLYFPLQNHFEQNFHVAHRLDQYNAGRKMDYQTSNPDIIAQAMVEELNRNAAFRPVESDGAFRAASMLAELI